MAKLKFRHLPITSQGKIVGIISSRDLMYLRNLIPRERTNE
jgi:CBS domain-containing protein